MILINKVENETSNKWSKKTIDTFFVISPHGENTVLYYIYTTYLIGIDYSYLSMIHL